MAIKFPVSMGTILLCNYALGGFRAPEMIKRRPAIVVSPRLPFRDGLCTVVSLSTRPPQRIANYIVDLTLSPPLPEPFGALQCWAKCDMLATVSFAVSYTHLTPEDFDRIRRGILAALGLVSTLDLT